MEKRGVLCHGIKETERNAEQILKQNINSNLDDLHLMVERHMINKKEYFKYLFILPVYSLLIINQFLIT